MVRAIKPHRVSDARRTAEVRAIVLNVRVVISGVIAPPTRVNNSLHCISLPRFECEVGVGNAFGPVNDVKQH